MQDIEEWKKASIVSEIRHTIQDFCFSFDVLALHLASYALLPSIVRYDVVQVSARWMAFM